MVIPITKPMRIRTTAISIRVNPLLLRTCYLYHTKYATNSSTNQAVLTASNIDLIRWEGRGGATIRVVCIGGQDKQLFCAWTRTYPIDSWETQRDKRIAAIQGKGNPFVSEPGQQAEFCQG